MIEIRVSWAGDLLHVQALRRREFALGERPGDFAVAAATLGTEHWPVVARRGGGWEVVTPDGVVIGLLRAGDGKVVRAAAGPLEVSVEEVKVPRIPGLRSRFELPALVAFAALVTVIALLVGVALPPLTDSIARLASTIERTPLGQVVVLQDVAADPASLPPDWVEPDPVEPNTAEPRHRPDGTRCGGPEELGTPIARTSGGNGIAGPRDNPDPHLAREDAAPEAPREGAGETPPAAAGEPQETQARRGMLTPWGREDQLGADERSARGAVWEARIDDLQARGVEPPLAFFGGLGKALLLAPREARVAGETARVILAGPSVTGSVSAVDFLDAVTPRLPGLRACYLAALRRAPRLAGRVELHVALGTDGRVSVTSMNRRWRAPESASPSLEKCLARALDRVSLPERPPTASAAALSLILEPGSAPSKEATALRPRAHAPVLAPCTRRAARGTSGCGR